MTWRSSAEEHEPDQKHQKQARSHNWNVLLDHGLEVDSLRLLSILDGVVPQARRQVAHFIQRVASVQQVLDVFRHDLLDVGQVRVEFIEVGLCSLVLVDLLCLAQKVVERAEAEWSGGTAQGLSAVRVFELVADFCQVQKRQLSWVRFLADRQVDDVVQNQVMNVVVARLDGGLGLGVWGDSADYNLTFLLLLVQCLVRRIVYRSTEGESYLLVGFDE